MKLPIGVSDFYKLRKGNYTLVDKSLLIKDVIDNGSEVIIFTRPRRFGKTLNMSMLYHYFALGEEDKSEFFKDLQIWQQGEHYQRHQGKYPVIFITLKDIKSNSYDEAYNEILRLFSKLYSNFDYLINGSTLKDQEKLIFNNILKQEATITDIKNSLKDLTEYLHRYHKIKPILIIDEYDNPIHASYNNGYYDDMITFVRHLLGSSLKDNIHLHKGIVTGILRIAKESIFSELNNPKVYSTLSKRYAQYFGFLESEVKALLENANADKKIINEVREWYNGYQFEGCTIYNPWSIINFIEEEFKFQAYWVNTSDNRLIDKLLLKSPGINQASFERLLQWRPANKMIEDDIAFPYLEKQPNALWTFLLHTGYLTVNNITQDNSGFFHADFIIPNKEVALLYKSFIIRWFGTEHTPSTDSITQCLINGDVQNFKDLLGKFLIESFSHFDTQGKTPEQIYHVFVLGLIAHLSPQYLIRSNRESGDGRYDVIIMPKDKNQTGIIFEFKSLEKSAAPEVLKKEAQKALDQIKEKNYLADFDQADIPSVLQLGAAFSGKHCEVLQDDSRVAS